MHLLNVKHWPCSHWNLLVMEVCMVKSVNDFFFGHLTLILKRSGNENDTNQVRCCNAASISDTTNGLPLYPMGIWHLLTGWHSVDQSEKPNAPSAGERSLKNRKGLHSSLAPSPPPPTRFLVRPRLSSRAAVALTLQARIHTGFHRFTEMGQIFPYRYILQGFILGKWNLPISWLEYSETQEKELNGVKVYKIS